MPFYDPELFYRAWQGFAGPHGSAKAGEKFRGDHVLVQQYPHLFVEDGLPREQWPTVFDRAIATGDAAERAREAERQAAFQAAAKANRVKLEAPRTYRLTRDVIAHRDGRPATILRGSYLLENDPLTLEAPDDALEPA